MNRIAMLGGLIAGLGFFFLPILNLKPNRLASGTSFNLLEFQGDDRYLILFILALVPLILAFRDDLESRGWLLIGSRFRFDPDDRQNDLLNLAAYVAAGFTVALAGIILWTL